MSRRVWFGTIAAFFGAILAADVSTFRPAEYPLLHKLFDGEWQLVRATMLGVASTGATVFAFLAANVKNGTAQHD